MIESPRVGVLGLSGGWSSELMADALFERTGFRLLIDPEKLSYRSDGTVTARKQDLAKLDALVLRKIGTEYAPHVLDRLNILKVLKARGLPIFSDPAAVAGVVDRLACTLALRAAGIPMPPTILTEDSEVAALAIDEFGAAVLKPLFSTKARGMVTVTSGEEPAEVLRSFRRAGNHIYYVQKLVEHGGRDLGLVFLGGNYIGAYARETGSGAWNTTVLAGGRYVAYDPSKEVVALARKAQAIFHLDYTTVDVLETEDGPLVLEVSAFGGFRGLFVAREIDAARLFADHVVNQVGGHPSALSSSSALCEAS